MEKHIILIHKSGVALLESEYEYIVVTGYNPEEAENQQNNSGKYFSDFTHFGEENKKAESLSLALDLYRTKTEEAYIGCRRMEELAVLFKDGLMADDKESAMEYFTEICGMDEQEKIFFGIEESGEEKRVVSWKGRGGR